MAQKRQQGTAEFPTAVVFVEATAHAVGQFSTARAALIPRRRDGKASVGGFVVPRSQKSNNRHSSTKIKLPSPYSSHSSYQSSLRIAATAQEKKHP